MTEAFPFSDHFATTRNVSVPSTGVASASASSHTGGFLKQGYRRTRHVERPLLSVVAPVYNSASTLDTLIQSVLSQEGVDIEFILIDGGSTDGTLDLLRKYDVLIDVWISEADRGVYDAMNKGLERVTGDWILFAGADDRLKPVLGNVVGQLKDHSTIYYGDVFMPVRGMHYDGPFDTWKLARKNICHQAMLYPARLFERDRFDLKYPIQADWEFNMRCWANPDIAFKYLGETIADFDDSAGLSSTQADDAFNADYLELVKKHFPRWVYVERWALLNAGKLFRKMGWIK